MMTIEEMIGKLEEARDELGPDAEVRIAVQPHWPIAHRVAGVTVCEDKEDEQAKFLWIAAQAGNPEDHPYAPRWAWGDGSEDF